MNGGHATIAYAAALLDIEFVDEAMQEPLVKGFLHDVLQNEILPTVPPAPGTDLRAYTTLIEERFANAGSATPPDGCAPMDRTGSRSSFCRQCLTV